MVENNGGELLVPCKQRVYFYTFVRPAPIIPLSRYFGRKEGRTLRVQWRTWYHIVVEAGSVDVRFSSLLFLFTSSFPCMDWKIDSR